mgnify:FL=1
MEIKSASFYISVADSRKVIDDEKKQIAFVGRSNVGKSSLLNALVRQKKLAKTSQTPGRTRLINYFLINNEFYFVDLPGYGFAKGNKQEVSSWQDLIEPYLVNNSKLKCVCMLVDSRLNPMETDKQMQVVLDYYKIPYIVIATKADKLTKSECGKVKSNIANSLRLGTDNIIVSSSKTNAGRKEILDKLELYLGE